MSEEKTGTRPRQVTIAAYTIMGGSAFVVLLVFETIANLHTLETREAVESFLSRPPGEGLGMSVDGALTTMRTLGMVAAGCATAAAILGFHVLRRSKPARVGLTVVAVPLLVSGMVTGGFLSSLVAACAFLLWLPPARDWFAGREPARPAYAARSSSTGSSGSTGPSGQTGPTWPPPLPPAEPTPGAGPQPMVGFGAPSTAPVPARTGQRPAAGARPASVVWACTLTWLFSGLGAVAMVAGLVYLGLSPDRVLDELRATNPEVAEAGLTDRMILGATFVTGGLVVVWALSAMALAALVFRGVGWARVALLVSTGGAVALLGLATLSQFVLVVPFCAAAVTLAMLVRPETRAWVNRG